MKKNVSQCPAPPPPRKELSDNPVKLCNEISRLFRATVRESRSFEGVMTQPGAMLVLSFLAIGDGTTQLELVKATHLKAPTVSAILKTMESEGIVRRVPDEKDLRAIRVFLTDKGRAIDVENIERIKEITRLSLQGLDEKEEALLMSLLTKLRNNLLEQREEKAK